MVGRALPTPTDEHPKIYRMKLWATNEVRAKSKFWSVHYTLGPMLALSDCVLVRISDGGVSLDCAQVLPEKAQEGEEEQWPDACHQRGIPILSPLSMVYE